MSWQIRLSTGERVITEDAITPVWRDTIWGGGWSCRDDWIDPMYDITSIESAQTFVDTYLAEQYPGDVFCVAWEEGDRKRTKFQLKKNKY